jgi:hypothetical protein
MVFCQGYKLVIAGMTVLAGYQAAIFVSGDKKGRAFYEPCIYSKNTLLLKGV